MSGFSRTYRLISKKDFQFVFDQAKKVYSNDLCALYRRNLRDNARLGIIISKQFAKLAVERNSLRRIIRESFRLHKESLKGLDIIIRMRSEWTPTCADLLQDKKKIRDDIDKLWQILSKAAY